MVLSSLCIMTSSGLLSSRTSCMLLTLLLWLPVLTDMLGMEWLLPRLSIFLLRFDPCSLSYKTRGISYRSCRRSPAQHVPATPRLCFKGDSAGFKGLWAVFCQLHISKGCLGSGMLHIRQAVPAFSPAISSHQVSCQFFFTYP